MKANEVLRWLLAWLLMCCAQRPPLYPTTTGVMILTAVRKECSLREYRRALRCSEECVRVQVHRLHKLGLLEGRKEKRNGCVVTRYVLTAQGMRMVYAWVNMTTRFYSEL